MNKVIDLAIIGAGPAGMAAAIEAAHLGIEPVLIDSSPLPGGQVYRQSPPEFEESHPSEGAALFNHLANSKSRIFHDTTVWGIFPENRESSTLSVWPR